MHGAAVVARLAGGEREFSKDVLRDWSAGLRGQLVLPRSNDYEEARRVWNATVDKKPGLIVRCAGVADVIHTVRWAVAEGLLLSVRGGGHNVAGSAMCDGWARELFDATLPFATGGVYVNFVSADERRVAAAYGPNHERLAALKTKLDPNNVFRANQNIRPG